MLSPSLSLVYIFLMLFVNISLFNLSPFRTIDISMACYTEVLVLPVGI